MSLVLRVNAGMERTILAKNDKREDEETEWELDREEEREEERRLMGEFGRRAGR